MADGLEGALAVDVLQERANRRLLRGVVHDDVSSPRLAEHAHRIFDGRVAEHEGRDEGIGVGSGKSAAFPIRWLASGKRRSRRFLHCGAQHQKGEGRETRDMGLDCLHWLAEKPFGNCSIHGFHFH